MEWAAARGAEARRCEERCAASTVDFYGRRVIISWKNSRRVDDLKRICIERDDWRLVCYQVLYYQNQINPICYLAKIRICKKNLGIHFVGVLTLRSSTN